MAPRAGFIVNNATTVGPNLDQAEPDALDFNLLGNSRYGVIRGCDITVAGNSWTINVTTGIVLVNGSLVQAGGQVTLPTASQALRFDLIAVNITGQVIAIVGQADENPVYPEYGTDVTILAAVFVQPNVTPTASSVTDKRIMLMERFVSAIDNGSLLHNANPNSAGLPTFFDIDYQGKLTWDGDGTALEYLGGKNLQISDHLTVTGNLGVDYLSVNNNIDVSGNVIASNLKVGSGTPTVGIGDSVSNLGDLYRDITTGSLWLYEGGAWKQLSTVPIPAGFVMPAFVTAQPGWLLCDGSTVSKAMSAGLWNARPDWRVDANNLKLPDARDCFFAWGQPGVRGGNTSGQVAIQTANLPPHKHLTSPSSSTAPAGSHTHTASMTVAGGHMHYTGGADGVHTHPVSDPGHSHQPDNYNGAFIVTMWGANNKLDGLFNDASHTYNVEPHNNTNLATTGVGVLPHGSEHVHTTNTQGDHTHGVSIAAFNSDHTHTINEATVGSGAPIDIRPPFMGMYLMVKT